LCAILNGGIIAPLVGQTQGVAFNESPGWIVTIPIVIAFFFTQRTFIEGISLTGLKG
jgi:ABC-type glycerol-3-phosphate transport system permease component